ncbi:unnamed protein product [Hydatigera taeniaeformis]|uniref:ANF_receptor domain-containing protein n=1 Tax=Hydatigena taeniaeformis TaxID=6205 RepID=A0A0R3WR88_HYDTA|nr:unnamed protein product [Hydatigera taeniaeformis]
MQVCQQHAIPCLTAQWDANLGTNAAFNVTINLHPAVVDVGSTLASFLHEAQGWKELGLIYAHDDSKLATASGQEVAFIPRKKEVK